MYAHELNSAVNTIPTSYDETAGSLMFTAASTGQFEVLNRTQSVLVMTFVSSTDTQTPVSSVTSNRHQCFIPPAPSGSSAGFVHDFFKVKQGDRVYLRAHSSSGATSSGWVFFTTWQTCVNFVADIYIRLGFANATSLRQANSPLQDGP